MPYGYLHHSDDRQQWMVDKEAAPIVKRIFERIIQGLIKKLYESYAAGTLPEKYFTELLTAYDTDQETLDNEIERLQGEVDRYNTESVRADKFIELVKRHTEFTELSPFLLNEFIEKVIVQEAVKIKDKGTMQIDIYLNLSEGLNCQKQRNSERKNPNEQAERN